jgi:hypothetical protein
MHWVNILSAVNCDTCWFILHIYVHALAIQVKCSVDKRFDTLVPVVKIYQDMQIRIQGYFSMVSRLCNLKFKNFALINSIKTHQNI